MKIKIVKFGLLILTLTIVGCSQDCSSMQKPIEGNPGATTNQSAGYDANDQTHYHPLTDDTKQYRPSDPATVQPR